MDFQVLFKPPSGLDSLETIATHMSNANQHRAPDDADVWADAQAGITMGFRRLSIIHLSPAMHQPMASSGRFVMVFNGEIYNHLELRAEYRAAKAGYQAAAVNVVWDLATDYLVKVVDKLPREAIGADFY